MSAVVLKRSQAHNLAMLLEDATYGDGAAQHAANEWIEQLREFAGPIEPTSYAARVQINGAHVEEWARESASNQWWCLFSTRDEKPGASYVWEDLLKRAEAFSERLVIKADGR